MRHAAILATALCALAPAPALASDPDAPAENATFVVNSRDDADDGACDAAHCSLREAILAANADPLYDRIAFGLPEEPFVIHPEAALPWILQPVLVDGTTQPAVEIDGRSMGLHEDGLVVVAGGTTVRGLVIRGVSGAAVRLRQGAGTRVEGNTIFWGGLGNFIGVLIEDATGSVVGGSEPGQGNAILGDPANPHEMIGVEIRQGLRQGLGGTRIEGNEIRDVDYGVFVFGGEGTEVGGVAPGAGNGIAGFRKAGVLVQEGSYATRAAILGNSIHLSGGLGIDLGFDGRTPNDFQDADLGANRRQNFPTLDSAELAGGWLTVRGSLHSAPSARFRIELFASEWAGAGTGGQQLLGALEGASDPDGNLPFAADYAVGDGLRGGYVSATATELDARETSEFSDALPIALLDRDGDGVPDASDLCPDDFDPDQADADADGAGDACDADDDGDGVSDLDEAAAGTDPQRADTDGDGLGDGGDACPLAAAAGADVDADGCTDTLAELEQIVAAIQPKPPGGLLAKLEDAERALARGRPDLAIQKLEDFCSQVDAQRGRLGDAQADFLIAYAQGLIGLLAAGA
jgi:CSLREA domain-containing protein